jgi:5'-methylthioadenosine phosphorylase
VHIGFADPYCRAGRQSVIEAAQGGDISVVGSGTMVVMEGPRFSSRAESKSGAAMGGDIVNMTGEPEATLARELAMCYTAIGLVTDLDGGNAEGQGVTQEEVFRVFARNTDNLRDLLFKAVGALPTERSCACVSALDAITLPFELP